MMRQALREPQDIAQDERKPMSTQQNGLLLLPRIPHHSGQEASIPRTATMVVCDDITKTLLPLYVACCSGALRKRAPNGGNVRLKENGLPWEGVGSASLPLSLPAPLPA